jgi:hypothetical protein
VGRGSTVMRGKMSMIMYSLCIAQKPYTTRNIRWSYTSSIEGLGDREWLWAPPMSMSFFHAPSVSAWFTLYLLVTHTFFIWFWGFLIVEISIIPHTCTRQQNTNQVTVSVNLLTGFKGSTTVVLVKELIQI